MDFPLSHVAAPGLGNLYIWTGALTPPPMYYVSQARDPPSSSGPNFLTLKCGLIFDNLWGPLGLDALSSQGPGEGQLGWLGWESEVWHKARRREAGGARVSRGGEYWAVSVRPCCLGLTTITPLPTEHILSGHRKALSYSH